MESIMNVTTSPLMMMADRTALNSTASAVTDRLVPTGMKVNVKVRPEATIQNIMIHREEMMFNLRRASSFQTTSS